MAAPLWTPAEAKAEQSERRSRFFQASDLDSKPVPAREWLVRELIPHRTVTLLSGDGGTGQSLLALQLAVAARESNRTLEVGKLARGSFARSTPLTRLPSVSIARQDLLATLQTGLEL